MEQAVLLEGYCDSPRNACLWPHACPVASREDSMLSSALLEPELLRRAFL